AAVGVGHVAPEVRVADLAALEQLVGGRLGHVAGDSEADADVAGRALTRGRDRGVDADDLAGEVDQCATGVTRVDRRVGLERIADRALRATLLARLAAF